MVLDSALSPSMFLRFVALCTLPSILDRKPCSTGTLLPLPIQRHDNPPYERNTFTDDTPRSHSPSSMSPATPSSTTA